MFPDSCSAIADEFSRQIHRFDVFLTKLERKWPSETEIIGRQLDQYGREIHQITTQYKEGVRPSQSQGMVDGSGDHSLPALPYCQAVTQDDDLALLYEDHDHIIPMTLPSYSEAHGEISEGLHGQIVRSTALSTASPNFETNVTPYLQSLNVSETEGVTIEAVPTLVIDPGHSMAATNDTIDPAMLRLDFSGHNRHVAPVTSDCQYNSDLSSFSTVPRSPPLSEERATLPTAKRKRTRVDQRARLKAISSSQHGVAGSSKRPKPQEDPSCSARSDPNMPDDILQELSGEDEDNRQIMCDLYMSTASADSMLQLKDVISARRQPDSLSLNREFSSVLNTVRALENLDSMQHSMAFIRRVLLLRLANHREAQMEKLRIQRENAITAGQSTLGGKLEALVLDALVQEAHPHTAHQAEQISIPEWRKKYDVERKALKNRLSSARNWRSAVRRFGPGIIALIPTGGVFQIQNQRFETLREERCEVLLNCLEKKENGYVREAAERLTPFVHAVYEGRDYHPTLAVESASDSLLERVNSSRVVELCGELQDNGLDDN